MEVPVVLSPSRHEQPGHIVDNLHRELPAREARFQCPEFLLGLYHIVPAWLTFSLKPLLEVRLISFVISSSGSWNWYVEAQSPHHKSHC